MNNTSFIKGIGLGVAVGAAASMIAGAKKDKPKVGKALRTMGEMVDNITNAIGL